MGAGGPARSCRTIATRHRARLSALLPVRLHVRIRVAALLLEVYGDSPHSISICSSRYMMIPRIPSQFAPQGIWPSPFAKSPHSISIAIGHNQHFSFALRRGQSGGRRRQGVAYHVPPNASCDRWGLSCTLRCLGRPEGRASDSRKVCSVHHIVPRVPYPELIKVCSVWLFEGCDQGLAPNARWVRQGLPLAGGRKVVDGSCS